MCGAHSHTSLLSGTMYLTGGIFYGTEKAYHRWKDRYQLHALRRLLSGRFWTAAHYPSLGGTPWLPRINRQRIWMSCWYASANDRLQLNTERESTYFQGIIPQENRCFFCTQKAVFPINRQDGINSLPCFFRPITAKKNGDFHPENMSFRHLITQSGAFCFFGSIKRDLNFLEKGCRFIFLSGN